MSFVESNRYCEQNRGKPSQGQEIGTFRSRDWNIHCECSVETEASHLEADGAVVMHCSFDAVVRILQDIAVTTPCRTATRTPRARVKSLLHSMVTAERSPCRNSPHLSQWKKFSTPPVLHKQQEDEESEFISFERLTQVLHFCASSLRRSHQCGGAYLHIPHPSQWY